MRTDYDQTGFRNIKDFFEGAFVRFEDLKNSTDVSSYNVTDNNVWKASVPKSLLKKFDEMGEPGYGPGKLIFEAVDAATNQEITEKTSYENISSEKMGRTGLVSGCAQISTYQRNRYLL